MILQEVLQMRPQWRYVAPPIPGGIGECTLLPHEVSVAFVEASVSGHQLPPPVEGVADLGDGAIISGPPGWE